MRSYSDRLKSTQIGAFPRLICQNPDPQPSIRLQGYSFGSTPTFDHGVSSEKEVISIISIRVGQPAVIIGGKKAEDVQAHCPAGI